MKKDSKNSRVQISNFPQKDYEKIETCFNLIQNYENFSLVQVELLTGKTHQIRAHFAFLGYPILGDDKYGNREINKQFNLKYQCLSAYKIVFHFDKNSFLGYLDKKEIELKQEKIDFLKYCK